MTPGNKNSLKMLAPSLLIAAGILAGTAVARATDGWWVMLGPLVLALATAGAGWITAHNLPSMRRVLMPSLVIAGIVMVAAGIIALRDPARVSSVVPILGACSVMPLLTSSSRRHCERGETQPLS